MNTDWSPEASLWLGQLDEALALLQADAGTQRQWLETDADGNGVVVDELALQFDDRWIEGKIVYASTLSDPARRSVDAVDQALSAMSGQTHARLWTVDALGSAAEWANIRALATVARQHLRNVRPSE